MYKQLPTHTAISTTTIVPYDSSCTQLQVKQTLETYPNSNLAPTSRSAITNSFRFQFSHTPPLALNGSLYTAPCLHSSKQGHCVCNIHIHVKSVITKSTNKRFHTYQFFLHSATRHDAMQEVQCPLPCFHLTQQYARSLRVAIVCMLIHDNRRTRKRHLQDCTNF